MVLFQVLSSPNTPPVKISNLMPLLLNNSSFLNNHYLIYIPDYYQSWPTTKFYTISYLVNRLLYCSSKNIKSL